VGFHSSFATIATMLWLKPSENTAICNTRTHPEGLPAADRPSLLWGHNVPHKTVGNSCTAAFTGKQQFKCSITYWIECWRKIIPILDVLLWEPRKQFGFWSNSNTQLCAGYELSIWTIGHISTMKWSRDHVLTSDLNAGTCRLWHGLWQMYCWMIDEHKARTL
jgi:hypothetical protein